MITSDFGSTAEIALGGGVVTIDPRDDAALTAAMRSLLTDASALAELGEQIAGRRSRSWHDYADELWGWLVAPELAILADAKYADRAAVANGGS